MYVAPVRRHPSETQLETDAMIKKLARRLTYVRYALRPGFWRWVVAAVDLAVADHIEPWSVRPHRPTSMIHPSVSFRSAQNVVIGDHTRIQSGCVLWASPGSRIEIGDHSGLGPGTMVFSSNHELTPGTPYHLQPWKEQDVVIGADVWVGAGCIIVAGVSIGSGSVVAAGSVVTRDIPPGSVVAGVPAKVIRRRD